MTGACAGQASASERVADSPCCSGALSPEFEGWVGLEPVDTDEWQ